MRNFSVKDLEHLSGIKAHTIRIWEKRYSLFRPLRSEGNARRYSVEELARFLQISLLNKYGHRISRVAAMDAEELHAAIRKCSAAEYRFEGEIVELVICMYRLDHAALDSALDMAYLNWPADVVVKEIIYPFLERVNLLYKGNRLLEEHLVVTAIRRKLLWCIEKKNTGNKQGKTILLFLTGDRQIDLLLLYFHYHLIGIGYQVIYLGSDISPDILEVLLTSRQLDLLLTYLPQKHRFPMRSFSDKMKQHLPNARLLAVTTGKLSPLPDAPENVHFLDVDQTIRYLSLHQ